MTRRATLILLIPLLLAALACNLPGIGQQPAVTQTAIVAASSTALAAATADALYTSIAQTQIALVPTATPTETATATITLTETAAATTAATAASGSVAVAGGTVTQTSIAKGSLKVGIEALVQASSGGLLNMRDSPGKSAKVTARIPGDTRVKLIDGPKAADGLLWWKVQVITSSSSAVGQTGWCAEFDGKVQTLQAAK